MQHGLLAPGRGLAGLVFGRDGEGDGTDLEVRVVLGQCRREAGMRCQDLGRLELDGPGADGVRALGQRRVVGEAEAFQAIGLETLGGDSGVMCLRHNPAGGRVSGVIQVAF